MANFNLRGNTIVESCDSGNVEATALQSRSRFVIVVGAWLAGVR